MTLLELKLYFRKYCRVLSTKKKGRNEKRIEKQRLITLLLLFAAVSFALFLFHFLLQLVHFLIYDRSLGAAVSARARAKSALSVK